VTASAPDGNETEDLKHRLTELADAVAARDTFIAVAAHELRNPMTPIIGQVDLLLAAVRAGRYSLEQVEQKLVRIQQATNQYLKRATTLLDVSRITTGKFSVEPMPFDLVVLLREVTDAFAEAARYARSSLRLETPPTLPVTLDRLATEQIIDNLVSNAIKYGAHTPVELAAEGAAGQVRITIRDHGCGITEQDRSRVFQRFERLGRGEQRSGFGVGLWVVGQLVEAMNGGVAIEDAPGGGALFRVTLPQHLEERVHE